MKNQIMKTIRSKKVLWLLSLLILGFSSCLDSLDIAPEGSLTMDEIFADNERVAAFLNSIYQNLPRNDRGARHNRGPVGWCDESHCSSDRRPGSWGMSQYIYSGAVSAGSHMWRQYYSYPGTREPWYVWFEAIRDASVFLQRINNANVTREADRARWKAEAHILRAWYYMDLLRIYGVGVPTPDGPYSFDTDFATVLKIQPVYDMVQFIIADCNAALAINELPWRLTTSAESGRVTKAVAEAIKSRAILYAASPLYNEGNDYWQEAYTINKTSLENLKNNGYELYKTVNYPAEYLSETAHLGPLPEDLRYYAAVYNEYFTKNYVFASNPLDRETIYQNHPIPGLRKNCFSLNGVSGQCSRTGETPSQEQVDAYETINGKTILNLQQPYLDEQHRQPNFNNDNDLYDEQNPYENRDPRFYASVYYNGSKRYARWPFNETPASHENFPASAGDRTRLIMTYEGEPVSGIDPTTAGQNKTRTGYFTRKHLHPNAGASQRINSAEAKVFRLGEVILNYAEAAANYGQLDDARNAVNEIRARAGMPDLPAGITQSELILRIQNERRVELFYEIFRYFDVRRWTEPNGDLEDTDKWVGAAVWTRHPDGTYTWERRPVYPDSPRNTWQNRNMKAPIPLDEANRLLSITGEVWQNPGW